MDINKIDFENIDLETIKKLNGFDKTKFRTAYQNWLKNKKLERKKSIIKNYQHDYQHQPEVKALKREYDKRPEVKARKKEYYQQNKEKLKKYYKQK